MIKIVGVPDKVEQMVNYAYENIPYYQDILPVYNGRKVRMKDLPLVTKDILSQTKKAYYNLPQDIESLKRIRYGRSSGTTGKITQIFYDPIEQKHSLQELWYYRLKWYGVSPQGGKTLVFYPTPDQKLAKNITNTTVGLSKSFLLSMNKVANACLLIKEYQPKYAIIQPSTMVVLYECMTKFFEEKTFPFIEYIEFNGEYLEPAVEKMAKELCPNAKIANQYGLQEVQSVAYRCPHGHMHLMTHNCYTEIINKDKNDIGDICITSLQNHIMPYIRFKTGDKGRIINEQCDCGCKNPIIEITRGRDNDFVLRPHGIKLHPYLLFQMIENITEELVQYRITQTDFNSFTFDLVITDGVKTEVLESQIRKFLEDDYLHCSTDLTFIYHDNLFPERKTGKQTIFINQMEDKDVI